MHLPTPHAAFLSKKSKILSQLSIPDTEYTDASPKGSVDAGIRDLIDEINGCDGLVTTSSCAGRVSVFVEGSKKAASPQPQASQAGDEGESEVRNMSEAGNSKSVTKPASSVGGKGGGGTWLFVSHDPVDEGVLEKDGGVAELFGLAATGDGGEMDGRQRLIHFKFEPMILHILTSSPSHAQLVLRAALAAGFRESGAVSLLESSSSDSATPMVAVRSMGLSFESLIGVMDSDERKRAIVSPEYLKMLVRIGNERFVENGKRIERFLEGLRGEMTGLKEGEGKEMGRGLSKEEEKEARREMKRAEGLRRQAEARKGGDGGQERREEVEAYIEGLEGDRNLS